ncbi:MAR-binding filament-like protein 1-1 [Salvia splendens]|uniref:MAR-binding filament-like protein 1-1 n=1 Tax=Salvia splendens TaxID=180675 RepID=UPI001C271655|nr:MAR-binding filament-like protein 1-1 [Salvia splendens]
MPFLQERPSGHPFFSILNVLGILGSGILAALFASKKEKAISDATVEHMKNMIKEKEAAIICLEKKFKEELINEKECLNKEFGKVKAEQQFLVNQLEMASYTIENLGQELQKEQNIVEELTIEVDNLELCVQNAGSEKRQLQQQLKEKLHSVGFLQERIDLVSLDIKDKEDTIWHLSCRLADKDRELDQLSSVYKQLEDHLPSLELENKQLKNVLLRRLCSELEEEVCKVQADFREARESLHMKLEEAKWGAEILSRELSSANDLFSKSNE